MKIVYSCEECQFENYEHSLKCSKYVKTTFPPSKQPKRHCIKHDDKYLCSDCPPVDRSKYKHLEKLLDPQSDWEERFDEKFEGYWRGQAIPDEIKFFISQEKSSSYSEGYEKGKSGERQRILNGVSNFLGQKNEGIDRIPEFYDRGIMYILSDDYEQDQGASTNQIQQIKR